MSYFNDILPKTGTISAYLGTNDPPGWIIMNGVARTNNADGRYNALNALGIGTGGSGTSNYTPPDYKGAFLRGQLSGTSGNLGTVTGNYQEDDYASHTHTINDPKHTHTMQDMYEAWDYTSNLSNNTTGANGKSDGTNSINSATTGISIQNNAGGTETRPYNFAVHWILKL